MKKQKGSIVTYSFIAVILFFMVSILVRFGVKNLFYDRLGMDNGFVRFLMAGMDSLEGSGQSGDAVSIDWAQRYPFLEESTQEEQAAGNGRTGQTAESRQTDGGTAAKGAAFVQRLSDRFGAAKEKLEGYCTTDLLWQDGFVRLGRLYNRAIGYRVVQGNNQVITMNNGYLAYKSLQISTADMENCIADLYRRARELDVDFLYVQMPAKVSPYDRQLPMGAVEYSNENADSLVKGLEERQVPVLDFRPVLQESGYEWYSMFYKTDHHWTTQAGLFAARTLAERLNRDYGYAFDTAKLKEDAYRIFTYENAMYGAQAKAIDAPEQDYEEDYRTYLPAFPTSLHVEVPSREVDMTGTFEEVMLDTSILEHLDEYEQRNPYGIVTVRNDAVARIENLLPTGNAGKKLLVIQDSYCYYVTPYLALDAQEIVTLYPGEFNGSIHSFLEQERPDMVIVALSAAEIQKINWDSHTSVYDLR